MKAMCMATMQPERINREALCGIHTTPPTTGEQTVKDDVLFEQGERQRGEMLTFISLGIAGIAMILFAVSAMFDLAAGGDRVAAALSDKVPVRAESTTVAPLAARDSSEHDAVVIDPPAQATNGAAASSPGAAIAVGRGSRIVRPTRPGLTGPRARPGWFADF